MVHEDDGSSLLTGHQPIGQEELQERCKLPQNRDCADGAKNDDQDRSFGQFGFFSRSAHSLGPND
jgi:hypothetical protein